MRNSGALLVLIVATSIANARDVYVSRKFAQPSTSPLEYFLDNANNQLSPLPAVELELASANNVYYVPELASDMSPRGAGVSGEYQQVVAAGDSLEERESLLELARRLELLEETYSLEERNNADKRIGSISEPINSLDEYKLRESNLSRFARADELAGDAQSAALLSAYMGQVLKKLAGGKPEVARPQLFSAGSDEPEIEAEPEEESESRFGSSEYIDQPLALAGHQFVQGGAGEGRQLLGPEGTFENVQVVKTDHGVPSYCNPPNPCPIGYTAADGCLEKFVNSASFSREYQAKQKCSCDNEHSLFNCAAAPISGDSSSSSNDDDSKQAADSPLNSLQADLATNNPIEEEDDDEEENGAGKEERASKLVVLARTIGNRFGNLPSVRNLINSAQELDGEDNSMISKKDNDDDDEPMALLSSDKQQN